MIINKAALEKTLQVLTDNGIEVDEAGIVLQAIGYTLLDAELDCEDGRCLHDVAVGEDRISVDTPAGVLFAEKSGDPVNPGIYIGLKPEGSDYEIDVALAEHKCEDIREVGDNEGDLFWYIWGNPYSEDYTENGVLKKTDVDAAVSEN